MSDEPRRIFRLPSASDSVEREVDDEIRFHIDTRSQELERDGMTPAAAQEQARREFGDAAAARTELAAIDRHRVSRAERGDWWSGLGQDARFAVRGLRRARGFAAAALLTLALGIGAATAMLSVVDSILLSPLPYPNHDRVVLVWTTARLPEIQSDALPFSAGNFLALRDRARSFDDLAAFRSSRLTITDGAEPEQLPGARVSAGLFEVLGVRPLLGRTFDATDDEPGAARATILSYGLWQRRFGGDPGVVGRSVQLNGTPYTVVGIMPRGFDFPRGAELPGGLQFPSRTEIWTPLAFTPRDLQQRGTLNIAVAGSLRPGVSAAQAREEVDRIMHAMAPEFGGKPEEWGGNVVRMQEAATQGVRGGLLLLLGAVGLVLLVACTNVSNLLLVRTASRQRELAVRAALGAGRGRLVRQLVSENVLLALLGAGLGVLLAVWATRALAGILPPSLPRADDIAVSWRVLLAALAVAVATGSAFGYAAVLHASPSGLAGSLRDGGRTSGGAPHARLRRGLVVGEVALSLMLLVGGALLLESFIRLQRVAPGFDPEDAIAATVSLPADPDADFIAQQPRWADIGATLVERVRAIPGVRAAGLVSSLPLTGAMEATTVSVVGRPAANPSDRPHVQYQIASPGYFTATGIPLIRGRAFDSHDDLNAPRVVMISAAAAAKYWPGRDAIGERIRIFDTTATEIVGIVGDVRQLSLSEPAEPTLYIPAAQFAYPVYSLVVRSSADPASLTKALRDAARKSAPGTTLTGVRTLDAVFSESLAQRRFAMLLVSCFAAAALLLAAVGLYGVIAYGVSQRVHEIGIRLALGAGAADVQRLVIREGVTLTLVGLVVGAAAAIALSGLLRRQLYEVSPADPATYLGIGALLVAVAVAASWVPAWRASRVEPVRALRGE
jgi:predicted permease